MSIDFQKSVEEIDGSEQPQQGATQECSSTEGLWSKKQVAEHLKVTERRVRTLVDRGDLPQGVLIKGRRWWDPKAIKAHREALPKYAADDDIQL